MKKATTILSVSLCCTLLMAFCTRPALGDNNTDKSSLIIDAKWELVEVEDQAVVNAEGQTAYFVINNDGQVTGFDGCNEISGEVAFDRGVDIIFSNLGSTYKDCEPVKGNERTLIDVLYFTHIYTIEGDLLTVNSNFEKEMAVFKRVDF